VFLLFTVEQILDAFLRRILNNVVFRLKDRFQLSIATYSDGPTTRAYQSCVIIKPIIAPGNADGNFHIFFFAVLQIIFIARDCYRTFIPDNLDRNLETPRTRDR